MDDVVQDAHIIRFVGDPQPGEFELPTAGDVEWLLFHTLDRSRSRVS